MKWPRVARIFHKQWLSCAAFKVFCLPKHLSSRVNPEAWDARSLDSKPMSARMGLEERDLVGQSLRHAEVRPAMMVGPFGGSAHQWPAGDGEMQRQRGAQRPAQPLDVRRGLIGRWVAGPDALGTDTPGSCTTRRRARADARREIRGLILVRGQSETNDPWPSRQASQPLAVSAQAR